MHDHSDVRVLQDLYEQLRTGELQKDHLLHKGRLSNHKLRRLGVTSSVHNIKSDPVRYQKYCQIKRYAERFEYPIDADDVQRLYRDLIGKIKAAVGPIGSVVKLSSNEKKLYKEALACPHWPILKRVLFSDSRPDYFYWSDNDLIDKAGQFRNFTHLKNKGGELHREITGRELKDQVVHRWPSYITHFYIGLGERIYRSQGELVLGNLIYLSSADSDWERQISTNLFRPGSNKPMTADFLCKPIDCLIEISMFEENGRGSRGKQYDSRRREKMECYSAINVVFLDSSNFYINGCIDERAFGRSCIEKLRSVGYINLRESALDSGQLAYSKGLDIRLDLTAPEFLDYLKQKHDLVCTAQLSNDKSFLRLVIRGRPDADYVMEILKQRGMEIGRRKISQSAAERPWANLDEARRFAAKYHVTTQEGWWECVKAHRAERKRLHIRSGVQQFYSRMGLWRGWTHFFDLSRNQVRKF